jgi:hypothetical protein
MPAQRRDAISPQQKWQQFPENNNTATNIRLMARTHRSRSRLKVLLEREPFSLFDGFFSFHPKNFKNFEYVTVVLVCCSEPLQVVVVVALFALPFARARLAFFSSCEKKKKKKKNLLRVRVGVRG